MSFIGTTVRIADYRGNFEFNNSAERVVGAGVEVSGWRTASSASGFDNYTIDVGADTITLRYQVSGPGAFGGSAFDYNRLLVRDQNNNVPAILGAAIDRSATNFDIPIGRVAATADDVTFSFLGVAHPADPVVTIRVFFAQTVTDYDDVYRGTDQANAVDLGTGDDVGYGFDGNDTIGGGPGADTLYGEFGDDWLLGGVGGSGYSGRDALFGGAGSDLLVGDGSVLPAGPALSIHRLYLATLNRSPDDAGWNSWTERFAGGQSLLSIADSFVGSPEFQTRYGALDNANFVRLLYGNVLERQPDAAGLDAWVSQLAAGASRASVVLGFSESLEFQMSSNWAPHYGQIYRLYGATLARQPDASGFSHWTDQLDGNVSLGSVAGGFVLSQEFRNTYGALDDGGFVSLLYRNVLGREADAAGLAGWVARMSAGESRTSVVLGFSESNEYRNATASALKAYVKTAVVDNGDTIEGGAGNDTLYGGAGPDVFVFRAGEGGSDVVHRLESWDALQFVGFGFASVGAAQASLTQVGADVQFSAQGQAITFVNANINDVRAADWLLA